MLLELQILRLLDFRIEMLRKMESLISFLYEYRIRQRLLAFGSLSHRRRLEKSINACFDRLLPIKGTLHQIVSFQSHVP